MASSSEAIHDHHDSDLDDTIRSDTPVVGPSRLDPPDAPLSPSITPRTVDSSDTGNCHLPIPTLDANKSKSSLAVPETVDDDEPLPPEIASADVSLSADGTFVETSSGPAARELKRRYDKHWGVNKDVRSPYVITAFKNQYGKEMYRVGFRVVAEAPAASGVAVEQHLNSASHSSDISRHDPSSTSRGKRRSRMSMHMLLAPGVFKNGDAPPLPNRPDVTRSNSYGPRKLRKTRSIPDMFAFAPPDPRPQASPHGQPATVSGRAHSHSVTGADMPRLLAPMVDVPRSPRGDMFGDVMHWTGKATPSSSNGYSSRSVSSPGGSPTRLHERGHAPAVILRPFGAGVSFDSPSRRPESERLPAPHMLREMQSFESGLTARAADPSSRTESDATGPPPEVGDTDDSGPSNIQIPSPSILTEEYKPLESCLAPLPETSMHSRYSTDVFDVLQTYRGLPLLDRISPDSGETTVIRMSLRSDDSAAPRDDPRFVIWGEMQAEREGDDVSISQGSRTDMSSVHSSRAPRHKNGKASRSNSIAVPIPTVQAPSEDGMQPRILVAATIERWIAQLTSDLDYDELLMFLLTYRAYIGAVDLLHLLICRFHWSLGQPASSQDGRVRQIVRVRTFVAIRYWLLTFFAVDFLPNRELRLLLADWLNSMIRDPILKEHSDGLSIVRKLKKIVKECKEAHTRKEWPSAPRRSSTTTRPRPSSVSSPPKARSTLSHLLGDKFAEAVGRAEEEEDSDLDLDFVPDGSSNAPGFPNDLANAHLTPAHVGSGIGSPQRPTTLVSSPALALLQQPLQKTILQQGNRSNAESSPDLPFGANPNSLPIHHNKLSRVFVKTLGRLGRWKRVLNPGSVVHAPLGACTDVSAFDLELNESGDLLTVRGGVERYLQIMETQPSVPPLPQPSIEAVERTDLPSAAGEPSPEAVDPPTKPDSPKPDTPDVPNDQPPAYEQPDAPLDSDMSDDSSFGEIAPRPVEPAHENQIDRPGSPRSLLSSSSSGSRAPPRAPQRNLREQWQFDVVSIDELDLSDTSSDHAAPSAPPGLLRKQPRKLPLRRDFEFLRRSGESVSSMGISRESYASGASGPSTSSVVSSASNEAGLGGGNIQQWQMNALIDSLSDEEEAGDVEDALRRLEGQINPAKRQEKASKVDGWVRTIQERLAAGDYGDEPSRLSDDEESATDEDFDHSFTHGDGSSVQGSAITSQPTSASDDDTEDLTSTFDAASTPIAAQMPVGSNGGPGSPLRDEDSVPDEAVPLDIARSRVSSRPSTSGGSPQRLSHVNSPSITSPSSKFVVPQGPRVHRSFILGYRAETLVQHFSMIDRELFMGVKFEELVLDDWMSCEEVNVLDWAQYLKDRARWKAESRLAHKTSALAAVRARFNLIATFTLSEVVLTSPNERAVVVGKLIRVAWKAYSLGNYNTLVAVIAGLRSEWVTKAMRRWWSRVGMWETRMFNDLTEYVSPTDDFKYIRQSVASMADAKPINIGSHTASVVSGGGTADGHSAKSKTSENKPPPPSACVPFIGVYLSQLERYSKLPDLIDPTAPNEAVGIDPVTGNFDAPAHPEVFSSLAPLPPSMQLEPLINVHKQRLIAGVIKSLVAGQHLASRVQYPVDKKLFQKCLKLRGLDTDTLHRVYANVS
ncbi:hypothetical protein PLICRDRAFT_174923 [Plicaturopsis crispa FD-325 SS-3]|nr:hypothetical protein PLICRDRAFT_174923 [Plicaturopsis crispa FD-325 SS-3]